MRSESPKGGNRWGGMKGDARVGTCNRVCICGVGGNLSRTPRSHSIYFGSALFYGLTRMFTTSPRVSYFSDKVLGRRVHQ